MKKYGKITGINGNMITVACESDIIQNEVGYAVAGEENLKAEVIRIQGNLAYMQVFESTKGLKIGDKVEFAGQMLSVQLGPGLLGMVYDGLQNPLHDLAAKFGFFLKRGAVIEPLDSKKGWDFKPRVKPGDIVQAGISLGSVTEGIFEHQIFVPFNLRGDYTVKTKYRRANTR